MRCVQSRVFGVDRHEHLNDVVVGKAIENDGRHREWFITKMLNVGVESQQPMLSIKRAKDSFSPRSFATRLTKQFM